MQSKGQKQNNLCKKQKVNNTKKISRASGNFFSILIKQNFN